MDVGTLRWLLCPWSVTVLLSVSSRHCMHGGIVIWRGGGIISWLQLVRWRLRVVLVHVVDACW